MEITKNVLEKLYITENKSGREIAEELGCCLRTVFNKLDSFNIPKRPPSKAIKSRKGIKFTDEHCEKISNALKGRKPSVNPETGKNWNWTSINIPCSFCKTPLERPQYKIKSQKDHFCNYRCLAKFKIKHKTDLPCDDFGKIKTNCAECNVVIYKHPYRLKRSKNLFCSDSCNNEWMSKHLCGPKSAVFKGGPLYYGPTWPYAKRAARRRDNDTCQNCYNTAEELGKKVDVHHIIPFRDFGPSKHTEANQLTNLICLCSKCHRLLERKSKEGVINDDYII
jgi:hypothetical protein